MGRWGGVCRARRLRRALEGRVRPGSGGCSRPRLPLHSIPVVAAHARVGDKGVYLTGLGTVTALRTVTVRTQVDGQLVTVAFKEGQLVRAGRAAGPDRSASLPGAARTSRRAGGQGCGHAEQRARRSPALPGARRAGRGAEAAARHAGVDGPAARSDAEERSGADRQRTTEPHLRAHHVAAHGTDRSAAGRPRQHRPHRPMRTASRSSPQRQPIAVVFTIPQDSLPDVQKQLSAGRQSGRRRLRPRARDEARVRDPLGHRQPDRSDDRHDQAQGDVRQRARRALSQSVRQRAAAGRHDQERGHRAGGGDPARPAEDVRLRRDRRQRRRGARRRGVDDRRRRDGRVRAGLPPARSS